MPASGVEDTQPGPHIYYAYGMVIHSDIALQELPESEGRVPDLVFRSIALTRALPAEGDGIYEFGEGQARIAIGGVGEFTIANPDLVEVAIDPEADPSLVSLILLGSVLATVLHFRGYLTLHASGVEINGRGIVLLGDKCAGKSSTAGAFIRAGYRLLTDDVMPIEIKDGARILPGFPQLKLTSEAAGALALPEIARVQIGNLDYVKTRLRLADHFMAQPVPAGNFYVLARGKALSIERFQGMDALAPLMRYAYHQRFGTQVFHGVAAARQLQLCAALISFAPVKLLVIPHGLDRLSDVVALVERDNP